MAQVLETFNFNNRGRKEKYPYDEWFDGQTWQLTQGDDFECTADSLRATIYEAAKKHNVTVSTSVDNDRGVVVVKAAPAPAEEV